MIILNHAKIILVGVISAFVAVTTSLLGITGTIIGSVISSVLYNVLSEALENPVSGTSFNRNFEWDIAYVFPLIVIAFIQLLLIFAFLAQWGALPSSFLNLYLSLQNLVDNNLYRVLGFSLLVMSIYPFILNPEHVNKTQGIVIAFIGLVFLARGFVDLGNRITDIYDYIFINFDFQVAIIIFILLVAIILKIIISAYNSKNTTTDSAGKVKRVSNSRNHGSVQNIRWRKPKTRQSRRVGEEIIVDHSHDSEELTSAHFHNRPETSKSQRKAINKSSDKIHFESNDLLDDYKK